MVLAFNCIASELDMLKNNVQLFFGFIGIIGLNYNTSNQSRHSKIAEEPSDTRILTKWLPW